MKQNIGVGAVLFALVMMVLGITQADAQGAADDPAAVEAGKAIFETNCAGCHGADGAGTERGRPLTGIAAQQADRSVHIMSVTDGKGSMPAFGENLSAEEIDSAISYVRLTFVAAEEPAAADEPEAETTLAITGAETPLVAVGGITLLAAGALLVHASRERKDG